MLSHFLNYTFPIEIKKNSVTTKSSSIKFSYPCSSYDSCYPINLTFQKGSYKVKCYGSGIQTTIDSDEINLFGAYTKGIITFEEEKTLYLYIGGYGKFNALHPDAAPKRGSTPRGSTDIRTNHGNYYDFDSLKSRIMVAASAGGTDSFKGEYGLGGALEGLRGLANESISSSSFDNLYDNPLIAPGGTQTGGGKCDDSNINSNFLCFSGQFGLINYSKTSDDAGGFGGNGYYSGATYDRGGNGGGGSSFISGHPGCDAITSNSSDFDHIYHTGQSIHYSNLSFTNTQMLSGHETSYASTGSIIITIISQFITCNHNINTINVKQIIISLLLPILK